MPRLTALAALGAILFGVHAAAHATTFNLVPQVTAAFDLNGNPVPLPNYQTQVGQPLLYQVNFTFTIGDLSPGDSGFEGVQFDVNLTSGLKDQSGWTPDSSSFVGPHSSSVPLWQINEDAGPDNSDLRSIVAVLGTPPYNKGSSDPRGTLGQTAPASLGSILVEWDGNTAEELSIGTQYEGPGTVQYATYNSQTNLINLPNPYVADNYVIDFGTSSASPAIAVDTPEPASLGILMLGTLALLRSRRGRHS
jgi:hypothetical protein